MPIKAGQINIEIRASAERLRADMDGATKEVKRIGEAGRDAGRELAKGMEEGGRAVEKVAKVTTESVVTLLGAQRLLTAELLRYSTAASASGVSTESVLNSYRALRLALSPTPFTVATVAVGVLAEETIRLVNARARLIEQQALISAVSGMPIGAVQRIDTVTGISGGNAANVRGLSSTLSQRMQSNQLSVQSGLETLGLSADDPAILEHIAAAFSSIEDPAKRAAAAVQLFGADRAGEALAELNSRFAESSAAVAKYGVTLDQVSRNQIYQARQDFRRLYDAITDFSEYRTWAQNFKTDAEIVGAAGEDMVKRWTTALGELLARNVPGMREFRSLFTGTVYGPAGLTPAQMTSGDQRKSNILTGLTADEMFAHEQALNGDKANTLEGQRAAQTAAQARADAAYGSLNADAEKRQENPNDPSLLSNAQRLILATQQQSAAGLATAIGEKVAAMEAAATAQKQAQDAAAQLAAFQGKSGERLQALSDEVTARAMADDPVSAARFSSNLEVNRDSDRTTPAERAERQRIGQVDIARVQAAEEKKRNDASDAAIQKNLGDQLTAQGNPLDSLVPSHDSSSERGRLDNEAESSQRDAATRAEKLATIQSQPGDEAALAQRVLDIRLQTVASERAILAAHASQYTLEDLTLATEKLTTEETNAQLDYQDSIAEIEKSREQSALSTGGAYQQQLRTVQQQLDALNQIKVTEQNVTDIELARVAIAQKQTDLAVQQLLNLGTLKDGWDAFWVEMDEQAEKPGKILYDGMNSALDKATGDLAKFATGQGKQVNIGKDMQSVGESMTQAAFKSLAMKGLGALGKKMGIKPPGGKPDGTATNPYYVIVEGQKQKSTNPLDSLPGIGKLPPALGSSAGKAAGSAASGIAGWIGNLFSGGGGDGAATAVDSSITYMAGGGDANPGRIYGVAEAGEAELISPKNSSRITPLSKLGGGSNHTYNIDARGADLGAENRVARAIEYAHNSAVSGGVRATAERAKRTPQRRG